MSRIPKYEQSFAYHIEVELGLDINKIWNFEKNTVNPYEIFKSGTKKVWLYCLEKDYHNDEGGYEITCNNFYGGKRCGYCGNNHKVHRLDSLAYLYPQIAEMIVADERNNLTMEDLYVVTPRSTKKFYFKCSECGKSSSRKISVDVAVGYKFSCEYCSDGFSIPEKFMINILKQLNVEFITQLTKANFKWCQNYRYDFYIPSLNMIIETHGLQHYNGGFDTWNGFTLEEEQLNDRLKKELALKNGIENYIEIDCRKSEFIWLKENAIKELDEYFNLLNIDWNLIWNNSLKSLVWKVKELTEKGYSGSQIADELKIDLHTVCRYKKQLGIKNQYEVHQENLLKTKELLQQGKTVREISKILNLDVTTIYKHRRKLNL